jgi:hypothetical protein
MSCALTSSGNRVEAEAQSGKQSQTIAEDHAVSRQRARGIVRLETGQDSDADNSNEDA